MQVLARGRRGATRRASVWPRRRARGRPTSCTQRRHACGVRRCSPSKACASSPGTPHRATGRPGRQRFAHLVHHTQHLQPSVLVLIAQVGRQKGEVRAQPLGPQRVVELELEQARRRRRPHVRRVRPARREGAGTQAWRDGAGRQAGTPAALVPSLQIRGSWSLLSWASEKPRSTPTCFTPNRAEEDAGIGRRAVSKPKGANEAHLTMSCCTQFMTS